MGKKNKIKKITHILYSGLGGTSDVCSILGKLDKKIKTKSSFIQIGPKRFSKSISQKNQKTYYIKTLRFFTIFYFLSVLNVLLKERPKLVVLHNYQIIPVFLYKFLCKFFKFTIDFFITLNKDSLNFFYNKIKISKNKIKIIPNAVNEKFIKKKFLILKEKKQPLLGWLLG